jgi:hypothetical protein
MDWLLSLFSSTRLIRELSLVTRADVHLAAIDIPACMTTSNDFRTFGVDLFIT